MHYIIMQITMLILAGVIYIDEYFDFMGEYLNRIRYCTRNITKHA